MTVHLTVRVLHARSPHAAKACQASGATCCVVGGTPSLGNWDPKRSPKLRRVPGSLEGCTLWEGQVPDSVAPPGTEFKYCVLNLAAHDYAWECSGPLHKMPAPGAKVQHEFEDGDADEGAGPQLRAVAAPAPAAKAVVAVPEVVELAEVDVMEQWIPWEMPVKGCGAQCPRTVFHAFNMQFAAVTERLGELKEMGFDAIQISPAQKSNSSHEWWARYQPRDYGVVEGLGSLHDLQALSSRAAELGLLVIGDVVFNHMLVVASAHEWEQAQRDPQRLTALQQRLAARVGPTFGVDDFQWPWFKLEGHHWDNHNRYEGWGAGEWSELRHCPKVVKVHQQHLRMLLDAGVRGFRFDAVKHMRPEHMAEYIDFLRTNCAGSYAYGEVLSVDGVMHHEYVDALRMATTDFALLVQLKALLAGGPDAVAFASKATCMALSTDSVRFARNHDTVMNPGQYYGLRDSCASARALWAWLLAVHDGTVLVFPEDLVNADSWELLRRALHFRAAQAQAAASEVCLSYSRASLQPQLLTVALRSVDGRLQGLCLLNLSATSRLRLHAIPLKASASGADLVDPAGARVRVQADGNLVGADGRAKTVEIQPWDAVFFSSS